MLNFNSFRFVSLQVRVALGAGQVVRLCASWDSDKVVEAAHRLLQHAPAIRSSVDLSGATFLMHAAF